MMKVVMIMLNRVILQGRLGKDPEIRTAQSGKSVLSMSVAVDRSIPNANGVRETDWFDCIAFGRAAEFIAQYFGKGSEIIIEGRLQKRKYKAQDGSNRNVVEIIVDNPEFAGKRVERDQGAQAAHAEAPNVAPGEFTEIDDDELPF